MQQKSRDESPREHLRYWLGRFVLKLFGWQIEGGLPDAPKYVLIAAPHTSNWDMVFFLACCFVTGLRPSFLAKHSLFRWPFGLFFRAMGGLPINRTSRHNMVEQCVQFFRTCDELVLTIAPEGTRGKVRHWKTGFYYIALGAGVPVALGFIDYRRKRAGVGPLLSLSGDLDADIKRFRDFYAAHEGKYPELTSEVSFRSRGENTP